MTTQKHTPGPWRAVRGDDLVFVEAQNIAHVGVVGENAYAAPFVVQARPGVPGDAGANAKLIAAAPALAEALIAIIAADDEFRAQLPISTQRDPVTLACDAARAALLSAGVSQP